MTKLRPAVKDGPYECYFKCGAILRSKFTKTDTAGWTWFTGYGKDTINVCQTCQTAHRSAIDNMVKQLNVRPPNYPKEFAVFTPENRPGMG